MPICLDDSSVSDLVRMQLRQLRAWTMGVRATPKHVAGTSAALGKKHDALAPLMVSVVKRNLTIFNSLVFWGKEMEPRNFLLNNSAC